MELTLLTLAKNKQPMGCEAQLHNPWVACF